MGEVIEIPVEKLKPNPWNVNFLLDHEMARLRDAMTEQGPKAVPPILVREKNGVYEIVDGEQRWRIAVELGWKTIPAIIMDLSDDEAKRLCLSYNILRGRADWFKLAELMAREAEMGANLEAVYSPILELQEISVVLALNELESEAKRILRREHLRRPLSLSQLAIIIKFPKKLQPRIARAVVEKQLGLGGLKHLLLVYGTRTEEKEKPEKPAEAEKPAKLEAAAREEEKKPFPRGKAEEVEAKGREAEECGEEAETGGVVEAAEEKAVYYVCECGVQYRVDFEKKTVEKVRREMGIDVFQLESTLPAVVEVTCPRCGAKGKVDVGGGEVEWSL